MTPPAWLELTQRVLHDLGPRWFLGDESVADDLPPTVTMLASDRYAGPGLDGLGFEGRDLAGVGAVIAQIVDGSVVELVTVEMALDPDGDWHSPGGGSGRGEGHRLDDPATRPEDGPQRQPLCIPCGGTASEGTRVTVLRLRNDVTGVRVGGRTLPVPDPGPVVVVSARGVDSTVTLSTRSGGSWSGEVDDIDRFFDGRPSWEGADLVDDPPADGEDGELLADGSATWSMGWPDPGPSIRIVD